VVGRYCEEHSIRLPTLRRVLSAGAPVPPHVLRRMKNVIHPDGDIHTPYGATESLPVSSIAASEVLSETALRSQDGAGTCVGRRFPRIDWKIVAIDEGPIPTIDQARELPGGQIGEIIVRGPVVTSQYVTRTEANAFHKIADGDGIWHRLGDLGYLDDEGRLWFCGRKAHRVLTAAGPMYSVPCEAILNNHEAVYRTALVGVGTPGSQRPVFVVEPWSKRFPKTARQRAQLLEELHELARSHPLTSQVETILLHRSLPVDIRHNAKISREKLAQWASKILRCQPLPRSAVAGL
jgi:olefin beta-lactone synthetase